MRHGFSVKTADSAHQTSARRRQIYEKHRDKHNHTDFFTSCEFRNYVMDAPGAPPYRYRSPGPRTHYNRNPPRRKTSQRPHILHNHLYNTHIQTQSHRLSIRRSRVSAKIKCKKRPKRLDVEIFCLPLHSQRVKQSIAIARKVCKILLQPPETMVP